VHELLEYELKELVPVEEMVAVRVVLTVELGDLFGAGVEPELEQHGLQLRDIEKAVAVGVEALEEPIRPESGFVLDGEIATLRWDHHDTPTLERSLARWWRVEQLGIQHAR